MNIESMTPYEQGWLSARFEKAPANPFQEGTQMHSEYEEGRNAQIGGRITADEKKFDKQKIAQYVTRFNR